jgi:hypothetical protein
MSSKYLHWFTILVLSSAMAIMIYFTYLCFYPFKTVVFEKDSFQTSKTQYKQGEYLTYTVKYIKYTNVYATVIRSFENDVVYQIPMTETKNPMGKQNFVNCSIKVPKELPVGKYILRMAIIYKLNPFREITHNVATNEFEVIQ